MKLTVFICICKTHLALYAWTQYQPEASQQSTNSYKMNEGCWTQRFITTDCLLYSNKVETTKRYFLLLSVCNTNNARKWSFTSSGELWMTAPPTCLQLTLTDKQNVQLWPPYTTHLWNIELDQLWNLHLICTSFWMLGEMLWLDTIFEKFGRATFRLLRPDVFV